MPKSSFIFFTDSRTRQLIALNKKTIVHMFEEKDGNTYIYCSYKKKESKLIVAESFDIVHNKLCT